MMDEALPGKPKVTYDFNLPHGIDSEEEVNYIFHPQIDKNDNLPKDLAEAMESSRDLGFNYLNSSEQRLDYRQFSPGFADEEGGGGAFECSWHRNQAEKQATKAAKGKKSSRRSKSDEDDAESSAPAKKPRQSLFGEVTEDMQEQKHTSNLLAPATAEHGIGNHISSLNLGQHIGDEDNIARSFNTGFGLACSDIGSFRDSPVPSDEEFDIPPDNVVLYKLRQNIDRKKAFTYIDTDKSGNWDPEQEAKERVAKLARARAAKREKKERSKKKVESSGHRDYNIKCIARLHFKAFGNVRNATNDEQQWPEDWSEIDTEQERELEEYRGTYRINMPDRRLQLPLEGSAAEVDDLTGHPAARGCKQCRKLLLTCSMAKSGEYPCLECIEDGSKCYPIQKTTVKGRCKQCDRTGKESCSFENYPTQPICDHCAGNDYICEELPHPGYKPQRVDLENMIYGPDRPCTACTACRLHKKRCSLKGKEGKPPCKYCRKNNIGCKFTELPQHNTEKQPAKKKILLEEIEPEITYSESEFFTPEDLVEMHRPNDDMLSREPTPELEMTDPEGNKGMLTKINTSFAHPIRFAVEKSAGSGCNFCGMPIFGMMGYFEREVHVIRWDSGLGYAEVGGGHAQNEGETIMCTECTNRRLQIIICPGHEFERLADADTDCATLTNELAETETDGAAMQYQLQRWCSMCFSPASFGCNIVQPSLQGKEDEQIEGCHLRLCATCEGALRVHFGGDFDRMAAELDSMAKISEADEILGIQIEGRPRADVGFLMQDGLLLRSVQVLD